MIREARGHTLLLRRTLGLVKVDMELMEAAACRHFVEPYSTSYSELRAPFEAFN